MQLPDTYSADAAKTAVLEGFGADDGNRTRAACLGSRSSTIELHRQIRNYKRSDKKTIPRPQ